MKKITFYLMMLFCVTAFSQIEIVENFDNGLPTGWTTSGLNTSATGACGGSDQALSGNLFDGTTGTATTPNYTGISNGTAITIDFSYNLFTLAFGFPPSQNPPPAGWGSIDLEYSTDGGTNWLTLTSVDDSDFTFVDLATCATGSASLPAGTIANGEDVQVRISTINASAERIFFVFDSLSITQESTDVPNCDSVLTSPVAGSTDANPDVTLNWSAATGLATGYTITVGTASGLSDIANDTTTETNYALTGLDYETEYFVNIVPSNGFGDADTGCTEESFTTRMIPIDGATCSRPIEILNLTPSTPFVEAGGDTNDYENNIDDSPCSNSYMRGKDVFYEITPTEDISIDIDLTAISNNGASIHVVEGCPDTATECVDYIGVFNNGGALNLSEVVLTANTTYYIVLSNSSASRTYTYNLIIQQNPCVNPEFTMTTVPDCGNNQFSVNVDVTYLGAANSLTLSDDDATTADISNISATGIVNIGPYDSDSTVNITLTNNDDSSCFFDGTIDYYCPPSNDECATPIGLTVNSDGTCTTLTAATNAGATESTSDVDGCGGSSTNDVWFSFTATETSLVLEYLNPVSVNGGGVFMNTELLSGACGSLTSIECYTRNYMILSNLTVGNTYYLRNEGNFSGGQTNFDVCLRTPPAPPVNDECTNATTLTASTDDQCDNAVNGTTIGATRSTESTCPDTSFATYSDVWYEFNPSASGYYEFNLNVNSGPSTQYVVYSGSCGALTELSACNNSNNLALNLNSAETYYVMVKSSQSEPGADFDLCVWQLPAAASNSDCSTPTTLLESPDDQGANTIVGNLDNSYPSSQACRDDYNSVWYSFTPAYTGMYNFDFTRISGSGYYAVYNTGICGDTYDEVSGTYSYAEGFPNSCFTSSATTADLDAGNTYLISVQASSAASFELFAYPDPSLSVESNNFETFKYYPNPVVNTLTIEAGNSISNVSIYNIVGQQVQVTKPNNLKTTVNMNALEDGVYFVTVTINNAQKTFKVIKK